MNRYATPIMLLSLLPVASGPAWSNPPCVTGTCSVPIRKVVKSAVVKEIQVHKEVVVVDRFVPVYTATVLPAAAVSYNITVPPPPPQPVQQLQFQQTYQQVPVAYPAPLLQASPQQVQAAAPMPPRVDCTPELVAFLQKIDARLSALEGGKTPVSPPGLLDPFARPQQRFGPKAFAKCAACHSEANAAQDGKGFVMFPAAGGLKKFSDRELLQISRMTYAGKMPPKDNAKGVVPLNDQEVAEIQEWLAQQK